MHPFAREIPTALGGLLPILVVRPQSAPRAVVAFFPSAFGPGPDLEQQMAEVAAAGALAVSFDPFHATDPGVVPFDDMPRVMRRLGTIDVERTYLDWTSLLTWARREAAPASASLQCREAEERSLNSLPVVAVGICFGGPYALRAAFESRSSDACLVTAAVTWHGSRIEQHLARYFPAGETSPPFPVPAHMHFGSIDPVVPPAALDALRGAFARSPSVRITVHEGATHGFSHPSAPAYQKVAERASMASVFQLAAIG